MASLTSTTIADTYDRLLALPSGGGATTTLKALTDGDGTTTFAMQLSTVAVCISDPTTSSATEGALLRLQSNDSAAVTGSGHRLGIIEFSGEEDASDTMVAGAQIYAIADEAFTATGTYDHATRLEFAVQSGTSGTDQLATPALVIDANSSISLSNNDGSNTGNTIFGKSAWNCSSNNASDYNTIFGELAMGTGTVAGATNNVAMGYKALEDITDGDYNTVIGSGAGGSITDGVRNTFIGQGAGETSESITYAVGIGGNAIGTAVATSAAIGTVAVGYNSLMALTTGVGNTAIGYQSLDAAVTSGYNTAVGYQSLSAVTADGSAHNTALGYQAGLAIVGGTHNTCIGSQAGVAQDGETFNTWIGYYAGGAVNGGASYCIGLGAQAMSGASSTQNGTIAIGYQSLNALTSGARNLAIGHQAADSLSTSSDNIAIGFEALETASTNLSANIAIGNYALDDLTATATVTNNIAIGYAAGGAVTTADNCTLVGHGAGQNISTGGTNIAIGSGAMGGSSALVGAGNVAIGYAAGNVLEGVAADNTIVGGNAGDSMTTGANNALFGSSAGDALTTGSQNTLIGRMAGLTMTTSSNNVLVGYGAGDTIAAGQTTTNGTVGIGYNALTALTTGDGNVAIGFTSGAALTDGQYNTLLGYEAGLAIDGGTSNVYIGWKAGYSQDEANHCIGIGHIALANSTNDSSHNNIAIGSNSLDAIADLVAIDNVAIGFNAGTALTSGDDNIMIGSNAGDTITTGSSNTLIGNDADVSSLGVSNQIVIGAGATSPAGNNSVTLGNGDVTHVYMASDKGAKVYADALELVQTTTSGIGLAVTRNLAAGSSDSALVRIHSDHVDEDQSALVVQTDNDTLGYSIENTSGSQYATYTQHSTHASFGATHAAMLITTVRDSNSAFNLLECRSDNGSDPEFRVGGDGACVADGAYASTGADYAEYFESKDGNAIAIGATVKLDGDKVVVCGDGDTPIGVVRPSNSACIVGNAEPMQWKEKYLRDDYGAYLREDYTQTEWEEEVDDGENIKHTYQSDRIPEGLTAPEDAVVTVKDYDGTNLNRRVLNPDYDESREYEQRRYRDEWCLIGLLGQIPITKGQPVADNWIKMKDVSDTVEMYFVK